MKAKIEESDLFRDAIAAGVDKESLKKFASVGEEISKNAPTNDTSEIRPGSKTDDKKKKGQTLQ